MKIEAFPTREELEQHASLMPEINPPAVLAMLRIMQAAEEIRCDINDVLEKKYQLSEGKLREPGRPAGKETVADTSWEGLYRKSTARSLSAHYETHGTAHGTGTKRTHRSAEETDRISLPERTCVILYIIS